MVELPIWSIFAMTQASFLCLTDGSPPAMLAGVERLDSDLRTSHSMGLHSNAGHFHLQVFALHKRNIEPG
jgi:hypothetical protein